MSTVRPKVGVDDTSVAVDAVATAGETVRDLDVPVGTTTIRVEGLDADTTYAVGVASRNQIGETLGAVVDVRTLTPPPVATVPDAPSALRLVEAVSRA